MHSSLIIAGSLASEVVLDSDGEGIATARFRVMMRARRRDSGTGSWTNTRPTVLPVVCRRRLAENVAQGLRHRDAVLVAGRLYVCETEQRPYLEIDAWAVGPDLARVRAEVLRDDLAA